MFPHAGRAEQGDVQFVHQEEVPCTGQSRAGHRDNAVVVTLKQGIVSRVVAASTRDDAELAGGRGQRRLKFRPALPNC